MNALVTIKRWHSVGAGENGLTAAKLDANTRAALLAQFGIEKDDVIRVTGRGLNLSAEEKCILVRYEELAIVWDSRPAAALHQRIVQRHSLIVHSARNASSSARGTRPRKYSSNVRTRSCGGTGPLNRENFPFVRAAKTMPIIPGTTPRWNPSRARSATWASCSTQLWRRRRT